MKSSDANASAASTGPRGRGPRGPGPGEALAGTLTRDRARLAGLWRRAQAAPADAGARAAFEQARAASVASRAARADALPAPGEVDPALPIAAHAGRIAELIRDHRVVVVAGETGSGKTTQLPKLCLAAGRGAAGVIGCTQPRRIAARAVARRVAEELQVPLGDAVGFQVRFDDRVSDRTAVKFMTDGILLAELASDRWLSRYDTLIIDEAHERSLNIDFLLGALKDLLRRRDDLHVVVTSATIDTARFAAHFGGAPVVEVEGRGYPVETRWRPLEDLDGEGGGAAGVLEGIVAACDELHMGRGSGGDTLVFLPGEREIRDAHRVLEARKYRHTEVLPLYARLSARDQDRVFQPGPQRRIVLATNVAETSLTVPRIHAVVDPGLARVKRYSPRLKLDRLQVEPVSQASADQRRGRCGRIAPGTCIRLYSEADHAARPQYTDPEIRRAALAGVILRMLSLGLAGEGDGGGGSSRRGGRRGRGDVARQVEARRVEDFPFLDPPDPRAIADGWQQLQELGAVDAERRLTATGRAMAALPVDVKLARMLVAARDHGVLREVLAIAAFLGIQDPRERPPEQRAAADAAHATFRDAKSEFVAILRLWQAYEREHADATQSQLRKWCARHFLGYLRMREWRELHRQLKLQCADLGWDAGGDGDLFDAVDDAAAGGDAAARRTLSRDRYQRLHRALLAGLPTQLGHRGDRGVFEGPRARKYQLFPGSTLASRPPPWVLSATLMETQKVWALTNAAFEPDWAIAELPHLVSRRHFDPRWSRAQGRVIGSEQVSLFGLVLAPKLPVHYGGLYPQEARALFLRDGLVAGEVDLRAAFLARNLRTLEAAREEEAKQRRAGLVVDDEWMAQWYGDRIPSEIVDARSLDAWWAKLPPESRKALEWSRDDLLAGDGPDADRFPAYLRIGDARLAVRYRFEPGAVDDGMTVVVPLHLLNALDAARLSWLAPGFVADKAAALIRSLPKAQRRHFVPAPDVARGFAGAHGADEADAIEGTLARYLKRLTGIEVAAVDFDASAIDAHLHANLRLVERGPGGRGETVLAESRDLSALRARFGARAADAFAERASDGLAATGLLAFPEQPVPRRVAGAGGVPAFPALQDDGETASLAVHADEATARRLHPGGVRRLLAIALAEKAKQARRQLPVSPKTALLHAAIESAAPRAAPAAKPDGKGADRLRADLVDGAFAALADGEGGDLVDVRDAGAFAQRRDAIGRALFGEAMRRLQQAEAILAGVAAVRAKLEAPLMGWARANLDDLRAQLEALVPPGFLRTVPAAALAEYPRWLKAMALRAERAVDDPTRDQQRMLELKPFVDALSERAARGARADAADAADWDALRWELEELRVSLFAQDLGAKGGVSPKKLAARLARLRGG